MMDDVQWTLYHSYSWKLLVDAGYHTVMVVSNGMAKMLRQQIKEKKPIGPLPLGCLRL